MKKLFLLPLWFLISCIPELTPPFCEIITPEEGSEFTRGESIEIRVEVSDDDGTVQNVRLFIDEVGISAISGFPYTFTYNTQDLNVGTQSIKVLAVDDDRKEAEASINFIIKSTLPVVETLQPGPITRDSVVVGGRISDDGGTSITAAGVLWGTEPVNMEEASEITANVTDDAFTVTLKDLPYDDYYVVAFADNESGRSYGDPVSFSPLPSENLPPSCEITIPSDGSVFLRGEIIEIRVDASDVDGSVADIRLYIDSVGISSITGFPNRYLYSTDQMVIGYHSISVKAIDNDGAETDDAVSIVLNPALPIVETYQPDSVTSSSAVVGGNILDDGGGTISSAGVLWSNKPFSGTASNELTTDVTNGKFKANLSDLNYETYYVMAFAENESGRSYGEELSFQTLLPENMFIDSRDGRVYRWVKIGTQFWMAENLAYLPEMRNPNNYSSSDPFYYVYDYMGFKVEEAKETASYKTYGVLYNYPAAMEACPDGWHLPTNEEEQELISVIGGDDDIIKLIEGGTTHWYNNPTGTNQTGFTALGAGRTTLGNDNKMIFTELGESAGWWTADICDWDTYQGVPFTISSDGPFLLHDDDCVPLRTGFSVRCLKD